jgi:hypothetical protein
MCSFKYKTYENQTSTFHYLPSFKHFRIFSSFGQTRSKGKTGTNWATATNRTAGASKATPDIIIRDAHSAGYISTR